MGVELQHRRDDCRKERLRQRSVIVEEADRVAMVLDDAREQSGDTKSRDSTHSQAILHAREVCTRNPAPLYPGAQSRFDCEFNTCISGQRSFTGKVFIHISKQILRSRDATSNGADCIGSQSWRARLANEH